MRRLLLRSSLWKPTVDEEVEGEFAFHLEMRVREYAASGMSPEAARQAALQRFGDVRRAHETCRRIGKERDRHMRRQEYFSELRHDVIFGLRQLWKNTGFACVAILTLALGIGGTTAVFSAVQAVVLRPMPMAEPDRLVFLNHRFRDQGRSSVSPGNFTAWTQRATSFEAMAAIFPTAFVLTETATPERLPGVSVSGRYFEVTGVSAALGRTFGPAEDVPGQDGVVVLSHRLWTRAFGGDPSVVGRTIRLNGRPRAVIGVMPARFDATLNSDELWVPLAMTPDEQTTFGTHNLIVLARLKPGVTIDAARAEMTALARQLTQEQRANAQITALVSPAMEIFVGDYRGRLFVLLGAVALVLLIGCGNVANLLLARGTVRSAELAVRAALGAGRGRLVRQLLTESVLLAILGALAGLVLAEAALRALIAFSPQGVPRLEQARLDGTTVAFAALVTLVSSVIFGLVPAWRGGRTNVQDALRSGRSGRMGASRDRVRSALVAAEVALALLLLVGSGLLIRSALAMDAVRPGFEPEGVLSARLSLPAAEYVDGTRILQSLERIVDAARAVPGVTHAAVSSQVPMGPGGNGNGLIPEGKPFHPSSATPSRLRIISPGYFETMRQPIREGRGFTNDDRRGVTKVTIVSETLARILWPNESAIGKRVACCERGAAGPDTPDYKVVVGVAADVRTSGPTVDPTPEFYLPVAQVPSRPGEAWDWIQRTMFVVVRTTQDPASLTSSLTAAIRTVDPNIPLFNVRTMEQRATEVVATSRFNTRLLTTLGLIGLLLAAIGIYGVIAYFVSQRTQEIGVRLALGASPRDVVRLVIRQALKPVLAGLVLGIAGALAIGNILASELYGVTARDPLTIAGVSVAFVLVAILASWAPARRAARVDPVRALNTA
jgi:putative ABC transport system permease protein